MEELGFSPEGNRILASIKMEDETGNMDAVVRAVGPDTSIDLFDEVHVLKDRYHRMTISGVECILFKESELFD